MSKTIYALTLLLLPAFTRAQTLSQFTWDSNPVTQALVGPNATSVSPAASSTTGGVGGTNGLNAGNPSQDIDLVVPGAVFKVDGLDISMDFRRKENGASFFTIGSLDFGINTGAPYAKFLLKKGAADTLVSLNNILNIPSDNAFHRIRYIYNNVTGVFTASVDGTVQTTYNGTPGRVLSWTGATNATIGSGMDGSGSNVAVLDNFLAKVPDVILPLELLSFEAVAAGKASKLTWTTTREVDVRDFIVERSDDGTSYDSIGNVTAQQGYSDNNNYSFIDNNPTATSFYRLRMTDLDGAFSYSPVRKLSSGATAISVSCYPNPVVNYVNVRISNSEVAYHYSVVTLDGKVMQTGIINGQQASINLTGAPHGLIFVRVENEASNDAETFKILKL
jgi:hypothetical protein